MCAGAPVFRASWSFMELHGDRVVAERRIIDWKIERANGCRWLPRAKSVVNRSAMSRSPRSAVG